VSYVKFAHVKDPQSCVSAADKTWPDAIVCYNDLKNLNFGAFEKDSVALLNDLAEMEIFCMPNQEN